MALITIKIERTVRGREQLAARRRGRKAVAVVVAAAVLVGGLLAASGAQAAGVVSITPKLLLNHHSLRANETAAVIVLGRSISVPTDATRVVLSATVTKPTANGTLFAYPQGNQAGASGDSLPYAFGKTATGGFTETVGTDNKVTFVNQGSATIRLSVSLTGYSTEVRAGDISATGGATGQVLTNTGTGAAWQAAGHAYGAFSNTSARPLSGDAFTPVASLTVPAGSWVVTFTTTISNFSSASSDRVICELASPEDLLIGLPESGFVRVGDPQEVITTQGLVANTRGGTITAQCLDSNNTSAAFAGETELIVNSVGAVTAPQPQPVPR